jgi:hypothetical protein
MDERDVPNPDFVPARFKQVGFVSGRQNLLAILNDNIMRFRFVRFDISEVGVQKYNYTIEEL